MKAVTTKLTGMGHGGSAIGKGKQSLTIFVPFGLPDETVKLALTEEKNGFARGELVEVLRPSSHRIIPKCRYYGTCGGCHFQHVDYPYQLELKTAVVRDQLQRIGKFKNPDVRPTLANPEPWAYLTEIELSPVESGGLGFWSPIEKSVIPIEACEIAQPELVAFLNDVDLDLPDLRKLTLKIGDDKAMLAALEVDDVEPPQLEADFPVSVSIVLPNKTAASLVGDHYLVQQVRGRDFRISSGCYTPPSMAGFDLMLQTVLDFAVLSGAETVLDLYSGVGLLTAFLAEGAREIVAIERNPDAVADAAFNLDDEDNISLYQDRVETSLPNLQIEADLAVIHPTEKGMTREAITAVSQTNTPRLITIHSDLATAARDGQQLNKAGYALKIVQPVDMLPQTYHVETVMVWERGRV